MVAHAGVQFLGNRPAQLDGQIGDAAARVQFPAVCRIGHYRFSWTSLDAARAAPAAIRRRRARLKFKRRHDLAQKEPRSQGLVDQAGVLADPAQARPVARSCAPAAARYRRRSYNRTLRVARAARPYVPEPRAWSRDSPCPRRNARCERHPPVVGGSGVLYSLPTQMTDSRARQQIPNVPAHFRAAIGQVAHLAGHAARDPVFVSLRNRAPGSAGAMPASSNPHS